MSRRGAITRPPKGGAISKDESKYKVGSDPLEIETTLKEMEPTALEEHKEMLKIVDLLIEKSDGEEKRALTVWKANLEASTIGAHVKKAFVKDFWAWLCGRGRPEDVVKTPWGRQPLTDDPEVEAYVSLFPTKMQAFRVKLFLLASRRPLGINECYLFYKYIVRGDVNATDRDEAFNSEFLKDWQQFGKDFDEARQDGQQYRRPRGSAHEMAPYDNYPNNALPDKGAEKAALRRVKANRFPPGSGKGDGKGPGDEDDDDAGFLPDADGNVDDSDAKSQQQKNDDKGKEEADAPPRSDDQRTKNARVRDAEVTALRSDINDLIRTLAVQKTTPATAVASGERLQAETSEKIAAFQAQLVQLREEQEFRKSTKTGTEGESAAKIAETEEKVRKLEGELQEAKELTRVALEEGEKNRQEWARQNTELVAAIKDIKVNMPAPVVNVSGAPAGQSVQIDVGALTQSIGQATASFNQVNGKLSEFVSTIDSRVKELAKDTAMGVGDSQAQWKEIQTIRQQVADMKAQIAVPAAVSNHPGAVEALVRAEDVDRFAKIVEAGFGKQHEELVKSWKTLIQTNDEAWSKRLAALQTPVINVDTSSVASTIDGVLKQQVAEITALQGTNRKIIDDVSNFHSRTLSSFTELGRSIETLNRKVDSISAMPPAVVENVAPALVDQAANAKAAAQLAQMQVTMEQERSRVAIAQAAMKDQMDKMAGQLEEATRDRQLSANEIRNLRGQLEMQQQKYHVQIKDLNSKLAGSAKAIEALKNAAGRDSEEMAATLHRHMMENQKHIATMEKTEESLREEIERLRGMLTAQPAPQAPPSAPPKEKEEMSAERPLTMEELRAGEAAMEEDEPEEMRATAEEEARYAQEAEGDIPTEQIFHPSALEEGELMRAAEQAGISSFSVEEATAPPGEPEAAAVDEAAMAAVDAKDTIERSRIVDSLPALQRVEEKGKPYFSEEELQKIRSSIRLVRAAQNANSQAKWTPQQTAELMPLISKAYTEYAQEIANRKEFEAKAAEAEVGSKRRAPTEQETKERPRKGRVTKSITKRGKGSHAVAVQETKVPAEAAKMLGRNWAAAQIRASRQKVKLGAGLLESAGAKVQAYMLQTKSVPSTDKILEILRHEAVAI